MSQSTETGAKVIYTAKTHTTGGRLKGVARKLADAAHGTCPYSKAIRGNVDVQINIV